MDTAALVAELVRAHGAHTIVLYGSRARGDWTNESDIDVACLADVAESYRDARLWQGMFLDGFVYPTAIATAEPTEELSKLEGASVLLDERALAAPWLDGIRSFETRPFTPLPETERQVRRIWAQKMLARVKRGDIEAHYRFHWLLFQLLEDHFAMTGRRYPGPKRAFAELAARDPETFAAFERALVPGAKLEELELLVGHLNHRARFSNEIGWAPRTESFQSGVPTSRIALGDLEKRHA